MKPRVAVFKFASCDGCQLQFLNAEDELLKLAGQVDFVYFPEARSRQLDGPYDIAFVEGSITTPDDARRIVKVREDSRYPRDDWRVRDRRRNPGAAQLGRRRAISARRLSEPGVHLDAFDFDPDFGARARRLRDLGLPRRQAQLLSVVRSLLSKAKPVLPGHSVCMECKRRGNVCVVVARGEPCLGPVTRTGCGALCPAFNRGCYGCFRAGRRSEHGVVRARCLPAKASPATMRCAGCAVSTATCGHGGRRRMPSQRRKN